MNFIDQRPYFLSGASLSFTARRNNLIKLQSALKANESLLLAALQQDLRKHPSEGFLSEVGLVYDELAHMIKSLKKWMRPRRVRTPLALFPSKSYIVPEARGRVLILSPWNYPLQLALVPLIGALAAGNVVTLKPSELTPHTAKAMAKIVGEIFPPELIQVIEGGVEVATQLLEEPWDFIFFTGSTSVGRVVAEAAAKHLTPCVLELGGKSPCIVTKNADLTLAARRIVFGKLLNAGQTCVAPDYVLVEKDILEPFLTSLKEEISLRYGTNPLENPQLPKIVSERHFRRLSAMIDPQWLVHGGRVDTTKHLIEPTLMREVPLDHPLMNEEIFGPILPVLSYNKLDDALSFVKDRDHPLALYIFSESPREQERAMRECRFGGGAVNDTLMHLANSNLPFGGVGKSGYGAYHGQLSFDCFVHKKAILKGATWIDMPLRYAPWTPLKDKIVRLFIG
jgi:aldehyde dehydrogenase (NAD+)